VVRNKMVKTTAILPPSRVPLGQQPTAPRTLVVAVLCPGIALLVVALLIRPYGFLTGACVSGSACCVFLAGMLYRKIGFAGDEPRTEGENPRDEYCV